MVLPSSPRPPSSLCYNHSLLILILTYILPSLATTPSFIPPPAPSRVVYRPSPDTTLSFIPPGHAPSYIILLPTAPSFISPPPPPFYLTLPSHQLQRQRSRQQPYYPHPQPPTSISTTTTTITTTTTTITTTTSRLWGVAIFRLFQLCCVVLRCVETERIVS